MKPEPGETIELALPLQVELASLILAMAYAMEHKAKMILDRDPESTLHLFFEPLTSQSRATVDHIRSQRCETTSFLVQILTVLVREHGDIDDPKHVFLKTLSDRLAATLLGLCQDGERLTDEHPFIAGVLEDLPRYFELRHDTQYVGRPAYWRLKRLYESRAEQYASGKTRWLHGLVARIVSWHDELRRRDSQLGCGIVKVRTRV